MGELSDFEPGQTVELSDGRTATVRFAGNTHFAAGDWIGVELDDASGKNDGEVQGKRYFDCRAGHGMFLRPAAATVMDQPTPKPASRMNGKANGTATKGRPPVMAVSGAKRQSILDPTTSKRQSMNAGSPTPGSRVSRLASPSKSPTKQLGSTLSSGNSSRTGTPSSTARKSMLPPAKPNRTSMGPPSISSASKAPRPSIAGTMNGSGKSSQASSLSRGPSNRISIRPGTKERLDSVGGESGASAGSGHQSPVETADIELASPTVDRQDEQSVGPISPPLSQVSAFSRALSEKPESSRGRSPASTTQRTATAAASSRETEDLKTKLRVIEKKRLEDREKLKAMERIQADRDRFEGIIQKLQSKYQPQQQEIVDLKKQIKEDEARLQELEAQQAENDTVMEMAALDREMAEETAESLKLELETLRQKHEEIELEVDVLREENQELGKEISPEEKTSQGWLQLERSNERLREALMRLRDVTQQQEADLRDQVAELEEDVSDLSKTKDQYIKTKETLEQSDAAVEDLRQQLDNALGAEEMIEELTDKNMSLTEKLDDLRSTIEDLESLKELNDELEINHIETEKQLQDELDFNEGLFVEEARKSEVQDRTIQDLEYTVTRFRDLVTNMQSDLEDLRTNQRISETEASELSSKSRAMMDLNMQLQSSASKAQVKAIDLELGKMEAQESAEHLAIIQNFLPESFKSERDSVLALLRFRRIGFKASTLHRFIKERVNGSTTSGPEDDIFAFCDVLDKLVWVSSTCTRFVNNIRSCDLDTFKRLGGASFELEPVERALNAWIDGLRRNELKADQCATELQRSIALMSHLADLHIRENLEHYPDQVLMHASVIQSHLENTATILSHIRFISQPKSPKDQETPGEDDEQESPAMFERLEALISQTRSSKVVSSKAIRQLEDLKSRSVTLDPSTLDTVESTSTSTADLASTARQVGSSILQSVAADGQQDSSSASNIDHTSITSLTTMIQTASSHLQAFYNLTNSLTQTTEFPSPPPPPPWEILAHDMKAASADLAARETELIRLKDEVSGKNTTLAIREKETEELSVKVEVLQKRVGESGGRREQIRELETIVESAKSNEKDLIAKLTHLRLELQKSQTELETHKQTSVTRQPATDLSGHHQSSTTTTTTNTGPPSQSTLAQISLLRAEIKTLESAIRHLRSTSHTNFLANSHAYLSTPLLLPSPPPPLLATEAKDVLKEMLTLVSAPGNEMVKLRAGTKEDRLAWRPARETSRWQVQRQREEWEEWREWRDGVAGRGRDVWRARERRCETMRARAGSGRGRERGGMDVAEIQMRFPEGKKGGGFDEHVRIFRPGEWEDVQRAVGIDVA